MKVIDTPFEEVKVVIPTLFDDDRGFFSETYNQKTFSKVGIMEDFVQDNHSMSREAGTIRGLHYQLEPKSQAKLVRVVKGSIFDVVVDIREHSPTFGNWFGVELTEINKKQLFVPGGFAHGFCTLVDHTEVIYKVNDYYSPDHERGIIWSDSEININWPVKSPILSNKDASLLSLKNTIGV